VSMNRRILSFTGLAALLSCAGVLAGTPAATARPASLRLAADVPAATYVGSTIVVTGRVRGARKGLAVGLQDRTRRRFATRSTAAIRPSGWFSLRWKVPASAGAVGVRVAVLRGHRIIKLSRVTTLVVQRPTAPTQTPAPASPPTSTSADAFTGQAVDEDAVPEGEGYGAGEPYAWGNCTRYAWTRRQDLPGNLGNAATWDERAAAQGFPVDTTPRAGDVAVAEAYQNGANTRYGHVFYVERVNADSSLFISEMNWVGLNVVSTRTIPAARIAGLHFIHRKSQPPPPPPPPPPPGPAPTIYPHHVVGTCAEGACGLKKRAGPGYTNYAAVGVVYDGNRIDIVCQVMGETVHGKNAASAVWDRLSDASYVTDYYTDTPNVGTWSPPIPRC
jgi:surface antigen